MPNWCENTLSIKGTKEQIVDFNKRYLPNGTFSFENIIPSPQTMEECPEDYILHNEEEANKHCLLWDPTQPRNWFNWYDWNCHHWEITWKTNIDGVSITKWHFIDGQSRNIVQQINQIGEDIARLWGDTTKALPKLIKQLQQKKDELDKATERALAITADAVLENYR